jgi:hypothetical protein
VNKVFHDSAYAYKNRHHTFFFGDESKNSSKRTQQAINDLLNDVSKITILNSIRSVTVTSHAPSASWIGGARRWEGGVDNDPIPDPPEQKWGAFTNLLSRLPYLKTLTFCGGDQMPAILLEGLQKYHQVAPLHVKDWSRIRDDEDHNNLAELALACSPHLRSIQARLWNTNVSYDLRFPALKRIIALAPNLQDVDISKGQSGCVVRGYTMEDLEEESRPAKLFEVEPSAGSIKSLKSRGQAHVQLLDGVIDSSKLERLDSDYVHGEDFFYRDGVYRFGNLKHVSIGLSYYNYETASVAVKSFVEACEPLESLKLTDRGEAIPLSTILSTHGRTLRKLALHETESVEEQRKSLTFDELRKIGQHCPLLEDFTLDATSWSPGTSVKSSRSSQNFRD